MSQSSSPQVLSKYSNTADGVIVQVENVIAFLGNADSGLGLKSEEIKSVVEAFPEVLGCSIEDRLEPNIKFLEDNYFLKGKSGSRKMIFITTRATTISQLFWIVLSSPAYERRWR